MLLYILSLWGFLFFFFLSLYQIACRGECLSQKRCDLLRRRGGGGACGRHRLWFHGQKGRGLLDVRVVVFATFFRNNGGHLSVELLQRLRRSNFGRLVATARQHGRQREAFRQGSHEKKHGQEEGGEELGGSHCGEGGWFGLVVFCTIGKVMTGSCQGMETLNGSASKQESGSSHIWASKLHGEAARRERLRGLFHDLAITNLATTIRTVLIFAANDKNLSTGQATAKHRRGPAMAKSKKTLPIICELALGEVLDTVPTPNLLGCSNDPGSLYCYSLR